MKTAGKKMLHDFFFFYSAKSKNVKLGKVWRERRGPQ